MKAKSFALVIALSGLSACHAMDPGTPARGVIAVNQPVIERQTFALDLFAPGGALAQSEADRLNAWFKTLDFGYGDSIYVDGPAAAGAREDVSRIAGAFGMMVSDGAPVTSGAIEPGNVRVLVSRAKAVVPNCPNWRVMDQPNFNNNQRVGFGCAVNSAYAAMIANPEDLVHGREGSGVGDAKTVVKAVNVYRDTQGSGSKGLQAVSSKGN